MPIPFACLRAAATISLVCWFVHRYYAHSVRMPSCRCDYFAGMLVCTPLLCPFRSHAFVPLRLFCWYAGLYTAAMPIPFACLRAAATILLVCWFVHRYYAHSVRMPSCRCDYFAGMLVCTPLLCPFRSHAFVPLRLFRWYAGLYTAAMPIPFACLRAAATNYSLVCWFIHRYLCLLVVHRSMPHSVRMPSCRCDKLFRWYAGLYTATMPILVTKLDSLVYG
ncbi:hypothetical protein R3P38DRAFT_3203933 [Favolaschia claudopus]|uniref:Uncharacterized protein n=1 Tax=Favolaschia claudopus TaxID=2862362 RepID=A0AAW0ATI9_9AGAR